MKRLLCLTMIALALGCSKKNSDGGVGPYSEAIIGAWEIDSMSQDGQSKRPEKPDPRDPYKGRVTDSWNQLRITKHKFDWISTDFIDYSVWDSDYRVEGNKIVTIDTDSSSTSDFIIHSVNESTLTLEIVPTGQSPTGFNMTFRRISTDQLATKTAKIATFTQSFVFLGKQDGKTDVEMNAQVVGKKELVGPGSYEKIGCGLNRDGELELYYSVYEVGENGSISIGGSERKNANFVFNGLKPDLTGPIQSVTTNSKITVNVNYDDGTFSRELTKCEHKIDRDGGVLTILSSCESADGKAQAQLQASCLLVVRN